MKSMKHVNMPALVLAGWAACAAAADAPAATARPPLSTYEQLDQLRSQNAILREQVKQLELKKALSGEDDKKKPEGAALAIPARAKGAPVQESFTFSAAQVQMVSGMGKNLAATITLQDGGQVTVQVGSHIPNLGLVKSIALNEVIVDSGGRRYSIPFAIPEAPTPQNQSLQGAPAVMLPSMPPLPPAMTSRGGR